VTRLLCGLCERVESGCLSSGHSLELLITADPDLMRWWADHKEEDRKRIEQERFESEQRRRRSEALGKLTPEERRLLRLGD
jgi:hypothetical protein